MDGETQEIQEQPNGGEGGGRVRNGLRMLETAARHRWPIPAEHRDAIVKTCTRIALDPNSKRREQLAAMRVLAQLEAQNQADEHKDKPTRHEISMVPDEALASYVGRYGLGRSPLADAVNGNGHQGGNGYAS